MDIDQQPLNVVNYDSELLKKVITNVESCAYGHDMETRT